MLYDRRVARSCIVGGQGKAADVRTEVFEDIGKGALIQDILGRNFKCIWKGDWKMREGRLGYNSSNGRYGILSSDLWIDTGLHCGECLQILMDGKWVQTRMKMDVARNWYLVGTPYRGDLEHIRVRI